MAATIHPSTQFLSTNFVIAAGSVLFRRLPETNGKLEICLLYNRQNGEWLLPKGRKDCGEPIEVTAVRETFEETGYACELLPCRMPTRALEPGVNVRDSVRTLPNISEPIAVTIRDRGDEVGVKVIWWFLTRVKRDAAVEKVAGTQTENEQFDSHFVEAEVATTRLTFQRDREVVAQALHLVKTSLDAGDQLFEHT